MLAALGFSSLALVAAKPGSKRESKDAAAESKPVFRPTRPTTTEHVWSDAAGRTIKAELLSVDGVHIVVRDAEGKSYRLNLTKLVPADTAFVRAAEPLLESVPVPLKESASRVDALVSAGLQKAGTTRNAAAAEDQFVRRLYLDIAGRIPTASELSAHLADQTPDKRERLIDTLLGSTGYNSQLFDWLADMLRLKDDLSKGVKSFVYQEWVKEQIAANRHWDTLVYELMTAEGRISANGAVGYLLRDRGMPLDNLSNTLTTFLGANVACAQCHDHPMANWTQRNFYEMASFFGATEQGYGKGKINQITKGGALDKSTVVTLLGHNLARVETLPANKLVFPKDYKYDDAKPGQRVTPKLITWTKEDANTKAYSGDLGGDPAKLRDQFAVWLTHPDNPRFAVAIANRLWKKFFGLGVQEPIGDLDDPKASSNPELLAHLAAEMKRVHFDLKAFQRIILNTQAYQAQASPTPKADAAPYAFPGPLLRRMSADQVWDSVLTLAVGPEVDRFKLRRADEVRKLDIDKDRITEADLLAKVEELKAAGQTVRMRGGKKKKGAEVRSDEFEGEPPPTFEGLTLARASELAQPARESHFLRNFGQSDRDIADTNSTEGGVPQALMMMNGEVQKAVSSPGSMVMKEAGRFSNEEEQVQFLYLSFLGRAPSAEELAATRAVLEKGLKLKDLGWVLLNTREFIFVQ
ncbi:MAG: Protein of unknown function (DUF1553)/Protein of unknown function (DUF1549) [Verrucomicrobia bacterium]|nr:MAG: Protein of unknown function (DUF1553)/Protein of unknown function (DUF1549) [Verrucomicrobiota bacterium]